jgi:hypothetical protein
MRRIQALAMAAAMTALIAFAAFPASAADFGDDLVFLGDRGFDDGRIVFLGDDRRFDDGLRFFDGLDGAAPASQEFSERRITSGAANPTTSISNTGDNVNLCAPVQQVVNTGNVANEQGVVEDNSDGFSTDRFDFGFGFGNDLDFTGSEINVTPDLSSTCDQTLNQAAAA